MSRALRVQYPGAFYHITNRGNAKQKIFLNKDDYQSFLDTIAAVLRRYNWICYSYCLMPNHYHLLIKTLDPNLSDGMRQLNGDYTQSFNIKHNRVGHLFQGRFKSSLIDQETYYFEVMRYIALNPVRAKLTTTPYAWAWSSYRHLIYGNNNLEYLNTKIALEEYSKNFTNAKQLYKDNVNLKIKEETSWEKLGNRAVIGSDEFMNKIKQFLNQTRNVKEISKKERFINRPILDKIFNKEKLIIKIQRDKLVYQAYLDYGYSLSEIGRYLNLHYSTISKIVKKMEVKN